MKSKVVDVVKKNDRVIVVKLIFKEKALNVVNAYAPQIGCEEKDNKCFSKRWKRWCKEYQIMKIR